MGNYFDADNVSHGFLRDADGAFTTFDAPDAARSQVRTSSNDPFGINTNGAITGWYVDDGRCESRLRARQAWRHRYVRRSGRGPSVFVFGIAPNGAVTGYFCDRATWFTASREGRKLASRHRRRAGAGYAAEIVAKSKRARGGASMGWETLPAVGPLLRRRPRLCSFSISQAACLVASLSETKFIGGAARKTGREQIRRCVRDIIVVWSGRCRLVISISDRCCILGLSLESDLSKGNSLGGAAAASASLCRWPPESASGLQSNRTRSGNARTASTTRFLISALGKFCHFEGRNLARLRDLT